MVVESIRKGVSELVKQYKLNRIPTGRLPGNMFRDVMDLEHLVIKPFCEHSMGNISYYLHFSKRFREPIKGQEAVDLSNKASIEAAFEEYKEFDQYVLEPGKSVIGQTYEGVGVSEWFLMELENTTSLGRVFLNHASHGYLHPGHGIEEPIHLMIELTNLGNTPVVIEPARIEDGVVVGTHSFRVYLEKLPRPAEPYKKMGKRLQMDKTDRS